MRRVKVVSSSISEIGYDTDKELLEIVFKRGAIYRYFKVPLSELVELMISKSIGGYFEKNIKNKYKYKKVGE